MLYIFDKDGTICRSKSGKRFINSVKDQELIPGIKKRIDELIAQRHLIAVISNQAGVSFGYLSYIEAINIVEHAASMINAFNYEMCPFHSDALVSGLAKVSYNRKPNPGMILNTIGLLGKSKQAKRIVYVGDRIEDKEALENAKIARPDIDFKFYWAKDFFLDG